MQDSFVFYPTYEKAINALPENVQLEVYKALVAYGIRGEEYCGENYVVTSILELVKGTIDSAKERREQNINNGKKGGRPQRKTEGFNEKTEGFCKKTENKIGFQSENLNVNVNVNEDVNDNVNVNVNEDVNVNVNVKDYCTARFAPGTSTEPTADAVISMPLNDGTDFPIFQKSVDEWEKLYPAVDVLQELRNMRGWILANPTRRKTKSGINRFIVGWLSKEQNKGRSLPKNKAAPQDGFLTKTRDLSLLVE